MAVLHISQMNVSQDDLGRYVTTLTQEVIVRVNQTEEDIFLDVLRQVNEQGGCIEYNNDLWEEIDCSGYGVNKAIETVNNVVEYALITPVTKISNNEIYRIEIEH